MVAFLSYFSAHSNFNFVQTCKIEIIAEKFNKLNAGRNKLHLCAFIFQC